MTYKTLTHTTFNAAGQHEIELVYEIGFWRWLLGMPARIETYVSEDGLEWYGKKDGRRANPWKEIEIDAAVDRIRYMA